MGRDRCAMKDYRAVTIKEKALQFGYDLCGIIDAAPPNEYLEELERRSRLFPASRPLYEKLTHLADPGRALPNARSIIVCVRRYNKYKIPPDLDRYFGKLYLADGRLSYSREFVCAQSFEAFLGDIGLIFARAEVPMRQAAVRAGLGRFGKNNFLYTKFGSWVWIDAWVTTEELEHDRALKDTIACPKNCTKCVDACPTGALNAPFTMNRSACIAHLSFSLNSLPPENLREKMGMWLYGCDVCQNVCPMNADKWSDDEDFPGLNDLAPWITPENIFKLDEEGYRKVLQPRFWYIKEDGLWIWKCNVVRAMANAHRKEYRKLILAAREHPDENIRQMALWASETVNARA